MSNKGKKSEFARTVSDGVIDGRPDLYNYVAKRVVEKEEAEKMGWKHYWDGKTPCQQGHLAARYVTNPAICVDCKRLAEGKTAIYPRAGENIDLTGSVVYVDPLASDKFDWTPEIRRQFLNAWINTTSIPDALEIVKAKPIHLISLMESDADFKAEYEAAERKVALVQSWNLEGEAASGSDRVKLALGSNKFPQFGAKMGLGGRPTVNKDQALAELTQILSAARRSVAQRTRLESAVRGDAAVGDANGTPAAAAARAMEKSALLGRTHDNSDLVSNTGN